MALYDYGNTRLRAQISRLLDIQTLEAFADLRSLESLISALTRTAYKESIETALTFAHGYSCLQEAINLELRNLVHALTRYYEGDALKKIHLIFLRDDVLNIKAILRGIFYENHVEEIIKSFSSLGTIPEVVLRQLAQSQDINEAINRMIIYSLPMALVLLDLRSRHGDLSFPQIELELEKWYFSQGLAETRMNTENCRIMKKAFAIEADIVNLNTVLRFIASNAELASKPQDMDRHFVPSGNISDRTLLKMMKRDLIEESVRDLFKTGYGKFLRVALDCYHETHLLSEFENQIRMYALEWSANLPKLYPLGIGVALGFIALKKSEIKNIRWIAHGIQAGFPPSEIKEKMEKIL